MRLGMLDMNPCIEIVSTLYRLYTLYLHWGHILLLISREYRHHILLWWWWRSPLLCCMLAWNDIIQILSLLLYPPCPLLKIKTLITPHHLCSSLTPMSTKKKNLSSCYKTSVKSSIVPQSSRDRPCSIGQWRNKLVTHLLSTIPTTR